MCKIKPNNCKIEFLCTDILDDCYQQKKIEGNRLSCYYHGGLNEDESSLICENTIAKVNAAVIFIKNNLGEENFIKYVLNEIGFHEKISEMEDYFIKNWDFSDGPRKFIDDVKRHFNFINLESYPEDDRKANEYFNKKECKM